MARGMLRTAVLAGLLLPTAARADPRLAGELLVADTHGQPFCQTRDQLGRYLLATIQHDPTPRDALKGCVIAPYATRVRVLQDLPPFGSRMHVVRALAFTPLQRVTGYTYSVGLADPGRFQPYSPFGEYFPRVP